MRPGLEHALFQVVSAPLYQLHLWYSGYLPILVRETLIEGHVDSIVQYEASEQVGVLQSDCQTTYVGRRR